MDDALHAVGAVRRARSEDEGRADSDERWSAPVTVLLPALLTGAAVAAASPRAATSRLRQVLPAPAPPGPRTGPSPLAASGRQSALACAAAGVAVALLLGGPPGVALGLALAVGGPRLLARLESAAVRDERTAAARDLPLALDLLSACLTGGAALPVAVRAVGDALPGPCGRRLGQVAAALDVGSPGAEAWAHLVDEHDDLSGAAARALTRAGEGGAPVADAVARLAAESRELARSRGVEAAERAGVVAVAPLGLCFLPAFVLLGVVPVVAGLVGPLLADV